MHNKNCLGVANGVANNDFGVAVATPRHPMVAPLHLTQQETNGLSVRDDPCHPTLLLHPPVAMWLATVIGDV